MTLDYKKSESTVYPALIDTTSSRTTVYLRKDVVEEQRVDEVTGKAQTYYTYEEAKVPRAEYEKHLQEQTRADVDYIALMVGVDLEEVL